MTIQEAYKVSAERGVIGTDAVIFSVLASYSGADDMCAVNHKRISRDSGLSLSTVKTRLKRMQEAGYIGIIPGNTKPYINTFVLFKTGVEAVVPRVSRYGYITAKTPCGELSDLVMNDIELGEFYCRVAEVNRLAHKENMAKLETLNLTG
jgi:hypothetical protein